MFLRKTTRASGRTAAREYRGYMDEDKQGLKCFVFRTSQQRKIHLDTNERFFLKGKKYSGDHDIDPEIDPGTRCQV